MKSILKFGVFVVFLFAGVFVFWSRSAQALVLTSDNKIVENASTPRALYLKNCARCHGADGKSETETGKSMDAPDLTSEYMKNLSSAKISRVISRGKGDMPGFGKKLKAKDIAALAGYLRSL